jgi:hypothetical protein
VGSKAAAPPPSSPVRSTSARDVGGASGSPSLPPSASRASSETAGHDLSPDIAQTTSSGRGGQKKTGAAATKAGSALAAQRASADAVGEDGSVSLRIDAHTLEVLRRALQISAPAAAPQASTNINSAAAVTSAAVAATAPAAQPSATAARSATTLPQYRSVTLCLPCILSR